MTRLDTEATTSGVESDDAQRFGRTARTVPAGGAAFFALDDELLGGLAGEGEDVAGCRVVVTSLDGGGDLRIEWSGSSATARAAGAAQDPRWRTAYAAGREDDGRHENGPGDQGAEADLRPGARQRPTAAADRGASAAGASPVPARRRWTTSQRVHDRPDGTTPAR